MGCLMVLLALISPRLVLFIMWVFTSYLNRAFDGFFLPFVGFLFLPATTLTYAIAQNEFDGTEGWGLVVVIIGVIADLGLYGGGRRSYHRR
jgi:hypothetical protein